MSETTISQRSPLADYFDDQNISVQRHCVSVSVVEQWLLDTWDDAWGRAETDTIAVQYGVMNA